MSEREPDLRLIFQPVVNPRHLIDKQDMTIHETDLLGEFVFCRHEGIPANVLIEYIGQLLEEYNYSLAIKTEIIDLLTMKEAELQIMDTMKNFISGEVRKSIISAYKVIIPQIERGIISSESAIDSIMEGFAEMFEADIPNQAIINVLVEEGLLDLPNS